MLLRDEIPEPIATHASAALEWINEREGRHFELTGLADVDPRASTDDEFELGLILCEGDYCAREQVRLQRRDDGYEFTLVSAPTADIPPLLDPPVGVRRSWLEAQLEKFDFVLLLFYRGLW